MALDDEIRILSGVGLFSALTADQLRLLAFGVETLRLEADEALYSEGQAADCAYIVMAGRVELFRTSEEGKRSTVGLAGQGTVLGELGLIAATRRLTDAVAVADTDVMMVPRKLFRRILEEYPEVAVALHARISEEFQAMVRQIEKLAPRFDP